MASEIQTTTTELVNPVDLPDLYEASIAELQEGMDKGHFTSVDLVKVCLYCAGLILSSAEQLCGHFDRLTLRGSKK